MALPRSNHPHALRPVSGRAAPQPSSHGVDADPVRVGAILDPAELDDGLLDVWNGILCAEPELDRPFFAPEYTQVFGRHLAGVRVAVLEEGDRPVGFLPFRVLGRGVAGPVAGRLDDFQGPVLPARFAFPTGDALASLGLSALDLDHRLERQPADAVGARTRRESWVVDLTTGFDDYVAEKREQGANWVKDIPRKRRKLGREHGDVSFRWSVVDPARLDLLRAWKADQRRRSGTTDPLDEPGMWDAFQELATIQAPGCTGLLSSLDVAGEPAALHFGLRSRSTLHVWFPTYADAFERSSPGLVQMVDLIEGAAEHDLTRVDFGIGDERYKRSLANTSTHVLEEHHDRRLVRGLVGDLRLRLRVWSRESNVGRFLKAQRRRARRALRRRG